MGKRENRMFYIILLILEIKYNRKYTHRIIPIISHLYLIYFLCQAGEKETEGVGM